MNFLFTLFTKSNFKILGMVLFVIVLCFGIKDYIEDKQQLKIEIQNRAKIIKEHEEELIYMSDLIREREVQKNDLISHNELLQKLNKRKSNVDTKSKTFKSRNISKFSF